MPASRADFVAVERLSPAAMPPPSAAPAVDRQQIIARRLAEERLRLRREAGLDTGPRQFRRPEERAFTGEERSQVTILFGGLTWKHEKLIQAAFQGNGYKCVVLPDPDVAAFQLGKEYGNNG
ncbi:MAG TPA: hypothetical protein VFP94_07760, partial [Terriglobales bacterium]|nr:hypothetical protein [Terriglobales bacterium]